MANIPVEILVSAKNKAGNTFKSIGNDISGVNSKLRQSSIATSNLQSSLVSAERASMLLLKSFTALGVASVAAIGFAAKISGQLESARQGFVALLGSAEEADATMARIKKEAAATPFELTGLVTGTQALTAITKDGDKAVDVLLDVGKAIATSGKGQAELDRVILNLQQIASTGKVTAMDIRQFQSAIPMFNDIVEAAGLTTAELQASENAAELLFSAFQKAGAEGGITAEGFTAQAGTWNQLVSNLKDNITILSSELINQTGIFDGLKNVLSSLNEILGSHDEIISTVKNSIQFLSDNIIIVSGGIIGALVPALYGLATTLFTSVIPAIIGATLPLLPFIAAGLAIGAVITGLIWVFKNWADITLYAQVMWIMFRDFMIQMWETLKTKIETKITELTNLIKQKTFEAGAFVMAKYLEMRNKVVKTIDNLKSNAINLYNNMVNSIKSMVLNLVVSVLAEFFRMKQGVIERINAVANWIKGQIGNWKSWGSNLGNAFVDGFWNALKALKDKAVQALESAKSVLKGESPPKDGPFKKIDIWGKNVGQAWVDGVGSAISELDSALTIQSTQSQGQINSNDNQATNQNTVSITVNVGMYAGNPSEKREIAMELMEAFNQVAKGMNMSTNELLGTLGVRT